MDSISYTIAYLPSNESDQADQSHCFELCVFFPNETGEDSGNSHNLANL